MTQEIEDYIASHSSPEPQLLHELYRATYIERLYPRMCSGHVQGRILSMISHMVKPQRVLALGTFSGYSAICLAEGLPEGGELHTVEIDDEAEPFIRRWLDRSPAGRHIHLHIGDAMDIVPSISSEPWDLVYIDANKRTYTDYLAMLLPLIRPGGYIIADNTLWDGKVTDCGANDPQTEGIRRFNDMVAGDPRLECVILPLRDGLTLIRVKP